MGRRRTAEVVAGILQAFLEDGTWSQADLARRCQTTPETIRKTLEDLRNAGWPLERESDPPQVYWSIPLGWLPAGILVPMARVSDLLRLLTRLPNDDERDAMIRLFVSSAPQASLPSLEAWVHPRIGRSQATWLREVEDAIRSQQPLRIRYFSVNSGLQERRTISFYRIVNGPPIRLCGTCHRSKSLKWFRLDRFLEVEGPGVALEAPRPSEAAIDAFVAQTIEGYYSDDATEPSVFRVRFPEARWVQPNLPAAMQAEPVEDGIRVTVNHGSVHQVARYVLSLAGAARPESETLRRVTAELARKVLAVCDGPSS